MEKTLPKKFAWWKLIVGYLFFLLFHQIYDILGGGTLAAILGEGIESIYAHMKMYFYAYLAVSVVEYVRRRQQISRPGPFWMSRMLVASAFPWMSIAIWFVPIALGVELGSSELAYSLTLTALGLYFAIRLDEAFEGLEFRPALKSLIVLAFLAALITYIGFSFQVPDNFFIVVE
jgi:hypothetical protein